LASRVLPLEEKRVLDVGCGVGGPASILARDYGARVDGVTIIEEHVALGRKLIEAARLDGRVCLRQGNAMKLDVEEGSYDVVFCLEAAHCFIDKPGFLAGAWRALRPGGRLIMADIVAATPLPLVRWQPALKLDLITAADWRKLVEAAGFAVEELTPVDAAVYGGWRRWNNYLARGRRRKMFEHMCPPGASVIKRQAKRVTAWAVERALCRSALHVGSMFGLRGYVLLAARKPA
jgi:2-polyprenyl-3-methyl-5-hydroxy-6-metoxy-1,4-benzoquinol methylase